MSAVDSFLMSWVLGEGSSSFESFVPPIRVSCLQDNCVDVEDCCCWVNLASLGSNVIVLLEIYKFTNPSSC